MTEGEEGIVKGMPVTGIEDVVAGTAESAELSEEKG